MLVKTTRMARLFDFYGELLTEKQQLMIELYYHHDLSLGEISDQLAVSRQAVHDNLRRTEKILQEYENKIKLISRYENITLEIIGLQNLLDEAVQDPHLKQRGKKMLDAVKEKLIP
ncbi:YlxM family DNA-binding protein [Metallumcola ferriviriculae]|uniref:UPF0122 protein MFMK1_002037 n=1 Tax=Metallumcola ferriviriculae TaxID=3039180 RepID=A0AAU0UNU3_9FIRM|nr:YlxM family DNA-binding protein [Desulfitibacteraceae bacterium MK1]